MDESELFAAFTRLHDDLPREAPGSDAMARSFLAGLSLPDAPRVAEMGCGPGASVETLLSALPGAHVTGLDMHPPFLRAAAARAGAMGAGARFSGVIGDLGEPPLVGPFDLIWCEGAAYAVGVEEALRAWAPLLAPGGKVVFSEAVWLTEMPDARALGVFAEYPQMGDLATLFARVEAAGYARLRVQEYGEREWAEYYGPLAARCDALEHELSMSEAGRQVLAMTREEIAVRAVAGRDYAYAMIAAERK